MCCPESYRFLCLFFLEQFYKSCNKWKQTVDDNPDAILEKTLYEQSSEFNNMLQAVSTRLGFKATLNLSIIFQPVLFLKSLFCDLFMMFFLFR